MLWLLIIIPAAAGGLSFAVPWNPARRALLIAAAAGHAGLVAAAFPQPGFPPPVPYGWIGLDAASYLFLAITTVIFLAAAAYAVGYLAREGHRA
ncbi:MAG: hypothetical protein MUF25_19875, partial [Pirellulaceae bacterium]|nr:hypothetical protein [Pirellulaceae bacterium]